MIYDTFMFFDEWDMLDIRLNTVGSLVDEFLLSESPTTHSGIPKPLLFLEKQDDAQFSDFFIHSVIADFSEMNLSKASAEEARWWRENQQRKVPELLLRELGTFGDWVVVSDVDEIWNPAAWPKNPSGPFVFEMEVRAFWLNGAVQCHAPLAVAAPWSYARKVGLQALRDGRESQGWPVVKNGGWAYSWVGRTTPEEIRKKLGAFAHAELDNEAGFQTWHGHLQGAPVEPLSDKLPPYVLANVEKFKHLIKS